MINARKRTKYRKPNNIDELWVVFDPGNGDIKMMIHEHWGEEIYFPHAVNLAGETYSDYVEEYKGTPAQFEKTAIFQYSGQGYVIGKQALDSGNYEERKGVTKYDREHVGALLVAGLTMLGVESHSNVRVAVTHPTDVQTQNLKRLTRSLKGKHTATIVDGRKVTYNVQKVIRIPEPIAGFNTFMLNTRGGQYARPQVEFRPGTDFLIFDMGAWLSAFVVATVNAQGEIELDRANKYVYQYGIRDVMKRFEPIVKKRYPDLLGNIQQLSQKMVVNALASDVIRIKGRDYDCGEQVDEAFKVISSPIRTLYSSEFSNGADFDAIIQSGGGGDLSFDHFYNRVWDHGFVFPAEDKPDHMRFSQIRGASKTLIPYLGGK